MKIQIHVHTPTLQANAYHQKDAPCLLIVRADKPGMILLCRTVRVDGPSTLLHGKEVRSVEGARVWIETEAPVYFRMKRKGPEQMFNADAPMKPSADVLAALQKQYPGC